jgi:hypothetical protein
MGKRSTYGMTTGYLNKQVSRPDQWKIRGLLRNMLKTLSSQCQKHGIIALSIRFSSLLKPNRLLKHHY